MLLAHVGIWQENSLNFSYISIILGKCRKFFSQVMVYNVTITFTVVSLFILECVQGIFDILAEMYPRPKALVLDWSHNVTFLFNCFAKLLAHPLQRPVQNKMDNRLEG